MKKLFFFAACLIASAIILSVSIQTFSTSATILSNVEALSVTEGGVEIEWNACYEYDNQSAYQNWVCLPGENSQPCGIYAGTGDGKGRCSEVVIRP